MTDQAQPANESDAAKGNGSEVTQARTGAQTDGRPALPPPANIYETQNDVQLYLDMPDADPASLDVTLAASRGARRATSSLPPNIRIATLRAASCFPTISTAKRSKGIFGTTS